MLHRCGANFFKATAVTVLFVFGVALNKLFGGFSGFSLQNQFQIAGRGPEGSTISIPEGSSTVRNLQKLARESRVILLAYPRSGSSFTGELLLSGDPTDTWYDFEPLAKFTPFLDEIVWQQENYRNASKAMSSKFRSRIENNFRKSDKGKRVKIEKTIRLQWHHIEDWICDSDIKIIHLVRDPRAMLYSMNKTTKSFLRFKEHPEILCEYMLEDLEMETKLSPARYIRVEYNDLVSQDVNIRDKVTRSLFEFIGIPFTHVVAENVDDFRQGWGGIKNKTKKERKQLGGFYGVYRPDNYDPDHWEDNMKRKMLRDLNKACGKTIIAMNYAV